MKKKLISLGAEGAEQALAIISSIRVNLLAKSIHETKKPNNSFNGFERFYAKILLWKSLQFNVKYFIL